MANRVSRVALEVIHDVDAAHRITKMAAEAIYTTDEPIRVGRMAVEVLYTESVVATSSAKVITTIVSS